ncbi:MAG: hypothetical protein EOP42_28900 [Sphingobacteriaceae bacterium]|nr:MAG: hypothetical protein EOP42_28900 [Sphingobacteriaceae bacterium]
MTTLTIEIPDRVTAEVSQIIKKKGGHIIANSKNNLSKGEQLSLSKALKEAEQIQNGTTKALGFDDLWND